MEISRTESDGRLRKLETSVDSEPGSDGQGRYLAAGSEADSQKVVR